MGLVPGLRYSAMAVPLPTSEGRVLLIDAGAHTQANAYQLAQSAALAHVYLKVTEGLESPRIGLLNIGQEPIKGKKVTQRAYALLERCDLAFSGKRGASEPFFPAEWTPPFAMGLSGTRSSKCTKDCRKLSFGSSRRTWRGIDPGRTNDWVEFSIASPRSITIRTSEVRRCWAFESRSWWLTGGPERGPSPTQSFSRAALAAERVGRAHDRRAWQEFNPGGIEAPEQAPDTRKPEEQVGILPRLTPDSHPTRPKSSRMKR